MNHVIYQLSTEDYNQALNLAKDILLEQLERDGLIRDEAKNLSQSYVLSIIKPNLISSWFKKLSGDETRTKVGIFRIPRGQFESK